MSAHWPTLAAELEVSMALLRKRLDDSPGVKPRAVERHAIERALDRYEAAAAAVTEYVDAFLASTATRPHH